ncbi:nucleotide kinase domain-containing protein [uncultured Tateyamaria sp.]|uniref:nucleotide kinase domain-containing protein n=1 Tax=uncultured Tateyamaria sp. TaxID=455651 RepID=UPI0026323EA1|nr:nucleotide kinase domain-containing protein [uncultured Tateyamaria sp.]
MVREFSYDSVEESLAVHHVRSEEPRPRKGVYELYWTFASRRQQAFERRAAGERAPWSEDPILREYKFCNVFRATDRVSQYLIREIAYGSETHKPADLLFQIVAFRTFSSPRTWDGLRAILGRHPRIEDLVDGSFLRALDTQRARTGGLYTGAFILCANKAYGYDLKHRNHVALFHDMFVENNLAEQIRGANSFERIVGLLQGYPLMGPFMSYQTAVDINYSNVVSFDEDDYTQAGPGALRGIKKAFESLGDYGPTDVIHWMVERQEEEFERLNLRFDGLWGRRLHAIDCQGLFCELDKYCREAVPELKSARSRIKARFRPSPEPLDLRFPPDWDLHPRKDKSRFRALEPSLFQ